MTAYHSTTTAPNGLRFVDDDGATYTDDTWAFEGDSLAVEFLDLTVRFTPDWEAEFPGDGFPCVAIMLDGPDEWHGAAADGWVYGGDAEAASEARRIRDARAAAGDRPDEAAAALGGYFDARGWSTWSGDLGKYFDPFFAFVAVAPGYGTAESLAEEAGRWRDGCVYDVDFYRDHVWHDDEGATLHTTDRLDSIGGVYFDAPHPTLGELDSFAYEYFSMYHKHRVLRKMLASHGITL